MISNTLKIFSILVFSFMTILVAGCEDSSDNKMVAAQECLDGLDESDPALADNAVACADKVNGVNSSHANVIRCSAYFMVGGITPTNLLSAFDDYEQAAPNAKSAVLMGALVQTSIANPTGDIAVAQLTFDYCQDSGVPSLVYIAGLSYTGTMMADFANDTDPADFLAACAGGGNCDDATIGEVVTDLYGVYCVGDAASNEVCQDINQAIQDGAGDPAAIAIALYGYL